MRIFACFAAAGVLLATSHTAGAFPMSASGITHTDSGFAVQLVQNKKSETVTQKVKRAWRNLAGYKFDVACPAFAIPITRTSCTATGKNRDAARAKCQAQHVPCQIAQAK